MRPRLAGQFVQSTGAAALAVGLLLCYAGPAAAAAPPPNKVPTTNLVQYGSKVLTLPVTTLTTMSGTVYLNGAVKLSWTYGFFNGSPESATKFVGAEWIATREFTPTVSGVYDWTCGVSPQSSTVFISGCTLYLGGNIIWIYTGPTVTRTTPGTFDWQMSLVAISRVRGNFQTRNPYSSPECTWGAAKEIRNYYGGPSGLFPTNWGNARLWFTNAPAAGWSTSWYPQSRSVVVFQAGIDGAVANGHVAWVDGIEFRSDGIYLHTTETNIDGTANYRHRILRDKPKVSRTAPQDMSYVLPGA